MVIHPQYIYFIIIRGYGWLTNTGPTFLSINSANGNWDCNWISRDAPRFKNIYGPIRGKSRFHEIRRCTWYIRSLEFIYMLKFWYCFIFILGNKSKNTCVCFQLTSRRLDMLMKLERFETGDLVNRFCITPDKQRSKTEDLWNMVNTLYLKNSILLSQTLTIVVLHIFNGIDHSGGLFTRCCSKKQMTYYLIEFC
jgi:hypothetical protein